MYYLTNFHLNLKLVDIIRATKIRIIILITHKLSVNIRILNSILFITRFPYSRGQSRTGQPALPSFRPRINKSSPPVFRPKGMNHLKKTATTYSPTVTQYHRRDQA